MSTVHGLPMRWYEVLGYIALIIIVCNIIPML